MNIDIDNLEEQNETGTQMIDAMFEKYLIRYVNVHFKRFHNSYEVGEWFIKEVLSRFLKTRVTDKTRALTGLRLYIKDQNVNSLVKELQEYGKENERK
ncbi:MAG: hypothetical protein AB7V16_07305 [Vulcanibacillus sp.]